MPTPAAATSSSNRALKTCQVILFQWSILSRLDYTIMAFKRKAQRVQIMLREINLAHKRITEYLGLKGTHKSNFMPGPASYWRFRLHFSHVFQETHSREIRPCSCYTPSFLRANQLRKPNTQKGRWATNQNHLKSNRDPGPAYCWQGGTEADKLF